MVVKGYFIDHNFKTRSDSTVNPKLESGWIEKKKRKKPVWPGWPDKIQSKTWYDLAVDPRLELGRVGKKNPVWPDKTQSKTRLQLVDFYFFY